MDYNFTFKLADDRFDTAEMSVEEMRHWIRVIKITNDDLHDQMHDGACPETCIGEIMHGAGIIAGLLEVISTR